MLDPKGALSANGFKPVANRLAEPPSPNLSRDASRPGEELVYSLCRLTHSSLVISQ
jgi:hypothetical protein